MQKNLFNQKKNYFARNLEKISFIIFYKKKELINNEIKTPTKTLNQNQIQKMKKLTMR